MRRFIVAAIAIVACGGAAAEKGDREKEIVVVGDRFLADQADKKNDTITFEGNVVVSQGTMRMTAAKVVVKQDPQKNKYYVATGSPVTFRQKRDNVDEWIEGYAERAEFDDRNDVLKLYDHARVKRNDDQLTGDYITYDMRKEVAEVTGLPGKAGAPPNRVKMIMTPPKKEAEGAKAAPRPSGIDLKTDPGKAEGERP